VEYDTEVKLGVYRHFAKTGLRPTPKDIAEITSSDVSSVVEAYQRLRAQRVLVLEADGPAIRMAPPFSGIATQHVVDVAGIRYHANCA
jgi:hypothetical protein